MKTILLIENHDDTLGVLRPRLKYEGYRLLDVNSDFDAVPIAIRLRPNLIIIDLSQRRTDGLKTVRRIRTVRTLDSIPIAVLTTTNDLECYELAVEAGADYFFSKPLDLNRFTKLI